MSSSLSRPTRTVSPTSLPSLPTAASYSRRLKLRGESSPSCKSIVSKSYVTMESKLRFIAADTPYEVDELFVDGIMELTAPDRMRILKQIQDAIPDMDYDEESTHYGGGRL